MQIGHLREIATWIGFQRLLLIGINGVQFITDHHFGLAPSHILFKNKLLRNSVI